MVTPSSGLGPELNRTAASLSFGETLGLPRQSFETAPHNGACDIAEVPPFWAQQRHDQGAALPVDVISNDCLMIPDISEKLLVVREPEIPVFNVLMQQEHQWTTTSEIRELLGELGACFSQDPSPNSTIEQAAQGLLKHGIVERHAPNRATRLAGSLLSLLGVSLKRMESEWRLNSTIVLDDKRNERWESGIEYPIQVALTIDDARNRLREYGYALVSDLALVGLGLTEELTEIFDSGLVVRVPEDHPLDRERARDVLIATYLDGEVVDAASGSEASGKIFLEHGVYLEEAPHIPIVSKASSNIPKDRPQYSRVWALQHEAQSRYIAALLAVVPQEDRRRYAEVGVNYLRTYTVVTEEDHADFGPEEEALVAIRVNRRVGYGARTQVTFTRPDSMTIEEGWSRPDVSVELLPGGTTLVFKDYLGKHRVTKFLEDADGGALREATVTTITWRAAA